MYLFKVTTPLLHIYNLFELYVKNFGCLKGDFIPLHDNSFKNDFY